MKYKAIERGSYVLLNPYCLYGLWCNSTQYCSECTAYQEDSAEDMSNIEGQE